MAMALKKPMKAAKKAKKIIGKRPPRLRKKSLGSTLVAELKAKSGRKDISFETAADYAVKTCHNVPIEQRAGYPLKLTKGAVPIKAWKCKDGKKVEVDFGRCCWLPDDWGQGVKMTSPTFRSTGGGGGTLTCFVSPDGRTIYYHKCVVEEYVGRKLTDKDGLNGQIRLAKLQATQAVQLARAQLREAGTTSSYIAADADKSFFKLLSTRERKVLPSAEAFHFCVVSARRATKLEGIRDIFTVQLQFRDAGVTPTWYVDEGSLADYKALGLRAVVGGKLTQARNKALQDAARLGKACVQCSDDISAWVYYDGPPARERSDKELNRAFAAATRYIVTPVAAARFLLAKMRGAEGEQPQLGGVYPLQSCSRSFYGDTTARRNFVIGDFFVVDRSKVRFDERMKLKEDYDFTCAHIHAHGSVMRCQRMCLNVKHYANDGGAVANRDAKGQEEMRNIDILKRKWPGRFRDNPKRKNEVILSWRQGSGETAEDDEDAEVPGSAGSGKRRAARPQGRGGGARKVKRTIRKPLLLKGLPKPSLKLVLAAKVPLAEYILRRVKSISGRTVGSVVGNLEYKRGDGSSKVYSWTDLRYDLNSGFLRTARA